MNRNNPINYEKTANTENTPRQQTRLFTPPFLLTFLFLDLFLFIMHLRYWFNAKGIR